MIALAGCGPKAMPCHNVFIGDATRPPEAVLVVTDGLSAPVDVNAGDAVPLVAPPQGGDVTYASARVRNVNSCGVSFRGRLSDPADNSELGFEARSSDLEIGSDGWGRVRMPDTDYFTNIALCPDNAAVDIQGRAATLSVTVVDKTGATVTVSQSVIPTCADKDPSARSLCLCNCSALRDMGERICTR
jgi:hypothetical protein